MDVFSAVADSTRRAVLDMLSRNPLSVTEIGSFFPDISQPGISKHLKVLKNAGLVKASIRAQKRVYSLNRNGFMELEKWISKYQIFWESNLDSLGRFLDDESREQK